MRNALKLFDVSTTVGCFFYAFWQGPFHGKWAEAAFWLAFVVSVEVSSWRRESGEEEDDDAA